MKIKKFETEDQWLEARKGKVTGTKLKDIMPKKRGTGKRVGFYKILAERIATDDTGENPMERGKRLETEAIEKFEEKTGKEVNTDLVMWEREDNTNIALSPDGYMDKEAVEVKCLASYKHIRALLTETVPKDYKPQMIQYFLVNDDLETLYYVFYDPRMLDKKMFYLEIKREDIEDDIEWYEENLHQGLEELKEAENKIIPF